MSPSDPTLDVLIVHHHTKSKSRPILIPGIGLLSMADYLDRNGIRAQVVHLGVEEKVDPAFDVVAYAERAGVRVVGLSIHWFFQLPDSLEVARRIKERHPETLIVLGGFTASFFCHEIIAQHPYVDVIVRGDGEVPLLALCRAFLPRGERDWAGVPNLVYRDSTGRVAETPFTQVMDVKLFSELRSSRVQLFKNHEAWFKLPFYMTQRFKDRFDFERKSWLCLAPTRGCAHSCPLCGGNREGQKRAYNRTKLLFQPHDTVVANIREAMSHGYGNFYLCSDPSPQGEYYIDLFRRLRREEIRVNFLFESWSLPSERFIDEFRETFEEGLLIISPDSADEEVRRRTKGPLTYSNADLFARLPYIWEKGLFTHLFFGFFLPGDTSETVRKTRRLAHELENDRSETFYLAFSTDPGSPVHLHPEEHDVVIKLNSLREYLEALPKERLSPNLMEHRPRSMRDDEAEQLTLQINLDQLLYKILPCTLQMLRTLSGEPERFHASVERLLSDLAVRTKAKGGIPETGLLVDATLAYVEATGDGSASWRALADLARFEGAPYVLMERHFSGLGRHYSSKCHELELAGEDLTRFRARDGVVTSRMRFSFDVIALMGELRHARPPRVVEQDTMVGLTIDSTANYVVSHDG